MANASNAVQNAANAAANAGPVRSPAAAPGWCDRFSDLALDLAWCFLWLALLAAVLQTLLLIAVAVKGLLQKPMPVADPAGGLRAADAVDPVKLIEALKALLETVRSLPAWIAIFLAGLSLLWITTLQPEACKTAPTTIAPRG